MSRAMSSSKRIDALEIQANGRAKKRKDVRRKFMRLSSTGSVVDQTSSSLTCLAVCADHT